MLNYFTHRPFKVPECRDVNVLDWFQIPSEASVSMRFAVVAASIFLSSSPLFAQDSFDAADHQSPERTPSISAPASPALQGPASTIGPQSGAPVVIQGYNSPGSSKLMVEPTLESIWDLWVKVSAVLVVCSALLISWLYKRKDWEWKLTMIGMVSFWLCGIAGLVIPKIVRVIAGGSW